MKKIPLSILFVAILSAISLAQKPPRINYSLKEAASFSAANSAPESRLSLWYKAPAKIWEDAFPIGNGRLGAMVYGGISKERIQ